jgi:NADH-quinone oxidoreductase subunit N
MTLDYATLLAVLPEILLVVLAAVTMGADLALPEANKRALGLATAIGLTLIAVVALLFSRPGTDNGLIFGGMIRHDWAAFVFRMLFISAGMITALISLDAPGIDRKGEYYALLITAVMGMNFMAASSDLIMLYLAIETTSIPLYLLAGYHRDDPKSAESGLKYFLFGAFTSTVMLYGFSLLYGFTGKTNFAEIGAALSNGAVPMEWLVTALLLVLVGFGFKVSAVPFHFWSPDVYEGAPSPITGFISTASKAAGFAVLIRVMLAVFPLMTHTAYWQPLLSVLAVFTMTVGNLLALGQKNIKRLLAYSSIAQAGYAFIGLATLSPDGVSAVIFYLMMYTVTNLATFGVIVLTSRLVGSDDIADYAGLSRRSPGLALVFMVGFLSLGGMPPLAGFIGKFFLFAAAIKYGLVWLALIGVVNAIVGIYYYLTVLKVVYLYRAEGDTVPMEVPQGYGIALAVCSFGVILLGTWAAPWFTWAAQAAQALFS